MASNKNIYLLTGDPLLKESFIEDLIKKHIPEEAREFNVDTLKGEDITPTSLLQRANTLPLLSPRRLILIKEIEKLKKEEQEKFVKILNQIPPSTILVFSVTNTQEISSEFLRKLKNLAVVRHFAFSHKKEDALRERGEWIKKELEGNGVKITPDALEFLARIPMELHQLRTEIEKLSAFSQGREITLEDVQALVTSTEDVKVYEFTNAFFEGKSMEAFRLLELLLERGDLWTPLVVLQALANQTRLLLQVKILQEAGIPLYKEIRNRGRTESILLNPEEIPSSLRQLLLAGDDNIFQYLQSRQWLGEKLQAQAKKLSKSLLYVILRLLHRLDIEIKSGAPPRERLEWFILWMAGVSPIGERFN